MAFAAARAASAIAQVAQEFVTENGGERADCRHARPGRGSPNPGASRLATTTITNVALGAHKAATKIITSEELRTDEAIDVDAYLASEFGGRIGALAENAFTLGDGSGKPLGLVTAGNGITVVTAATGSATSYKLADLKTVYKTLPQAYRRTASWLIGGDDFAELGRWPTALARLCCRAFSSTRQASSAAPCSSPVTSPAPGSERQVTRLGDFKLGYGPARARMR